MMGCMKPSAIEECHPVVNSLVAYWKVFNVDQSFTSESLDTCLQTPFTFSTAANGTIIMPLMTDLVNFFKGSYYTIYPQMCAPDTFVYYRVNKLAFNILTQTTALVAQQYVQFTTPGTTARFVEGMIFMMKVDELGIWKIHGFIEFNATDFPESWQRLEIPPEWKYDKSVPVNSLKINTVPPGLKQGMFAKTLPDDI